MYVCMIFIVKCVTITFFYCFCSASMEKHDFCCSVIPWNCTWYCTVPLEDLAKTSESLSFMRTRDRKYTANVQCSVQYTLLLLYLMMIMSYCV